ncbi:uncharacterized protein FOMMEDRAFT_140607 [Fomitiporia mediterranea MF3/22]|uniref:uncharacterized protein n=1 Tax=Fomitiporia mediterranea (strain MF3/22) TaxID=694068 RepID=UPI0004408435|nr:uncharacterized protein FOMMEDRAFT_140607 [Fomitiporia mediterranea MF3/22]EJD02712.1 hypothetical protein FOMMEDRAFT_140607 [Fomitiporia mediterranea MF3/22]
MECRNPVRFVSGIEEVRQRFGRGGVEGICLYSFASIFLPSTSISSVLFAVEVGEAHRESSNVRRYPVSIRTNLFWLRWAAVPQFNVAGFVRRRSDQDTRCSRR